jgi:hypothetical protein
MYSKPAVGVYSFGQQLRIVVVIGNADLAIGLLMLLKNEVIFRLYVQEL